MSCFFSHSNHVTFKNTTTTIKYLVYSCNILSLKTRKPDLELKYSILICCAALFFKFYTIAIYHRTWWVSTASYILEISRFDGKTNVFMVYITTGIIINRSITKVWWRWWNTTNSLWTSCARSVISQLLCDIRVCTKYSTVMTPRMVFTNWENF